MAILKHELWVDTEGLDTFVLAGPMGNDARNLLPAGSKLVWIVEAESYFEAMTKYYIHKGWGIYTTNQAWDFEPYPDEWLTIQDGDQSMDGN